MSRKTETNHSPCLINSLWQTALNCKFFFLCLMPEILILGGKFSTARACKTGGIDGESCYQNCQNEGKGTGLHGMSRPFMFLWKRFGVSSPFVDIIQRRAEKPSLSALAFHLLLSFSQPPQKVAGISSKYYLF